MLQVSHVLWLNCVRIWLKITLFLGVPLTVCYNGCGAEVSRWLVGTLTMKKQNRNVLEQALDKTIAKLDSSKHYTTKHCPEYCDGKGCWSEKKDIMIGEKLRKNVTRIHCKALDKISSNAMKMANKIFR